MKDPIFANPNCFQVLLGSRLIGEVYVLHERHICTMRKPKRGLICRRVGA